jgi:nucleoside-diphosphate-sugar epimerase
MEDPIRDLDLNARSQLGFLELLRAAEAKPRVVYASTRQVYGRPESITVAEDHPIAPVDVNGVSKFAADRFHLLYQRVHGIPASVLRLSNVYGPRQRLDGDHQGFLPVFCRQALDGGPITVYGDGSQRRDCLYVDDAVSALILAATREEAVGEVFNIGHHQDLTLIEIARLVVAMAGSGEVESVPWPAERKRIAIDSYRTDYRKATRRLDWKPTLSMEDGLRLTFDFLRAQTAAGDRA